MTATQQSVTPSYCNCAIIFSQQLLTFSSEEAKVAYTVNHLMGQALVGNS